MAWNDVCRFEECASVFFLCALIDLRTVNHMIFETHSSTRHLPFASPPIYQHLVA